MSSSACSAPRNTKSATRLHSRQNRRPSAAGRRRRRVSGTLLALAVLVLFAQIGGHAAPPLPVESDPLRYSRGFLVTGDYVTAGIRTASGTIQVNNLVPAGADVVGAFLYWETVHSASNPNPASGATFRGQQIPPQELQAHPQSLINTNTATCWGSASSFADPVVTMFRADVLHLLPKQLDTEDRWTGKYLANGGHFVTFPDGGTGNLAVQSGGGTLVLVYRNVNENTQPATTLRKVVMYDGVYAKPEGTEMVQTLAGFYQSAGTASKLTHLVGVGGVNGSETIDFRRTANGNPAVIASDPFTVDQGAGRTWNTKTISLPLQNVNNTQMPGFNDPGGNLGEIVQTGVKHSNTNQKECLAWGAIIFSTAVKDDDHDGLPDALESHAYKDPPTASSYPDPLDLPDLGAMGATVGQPDLIVEFNGMDTTGTTYGGNPGPAHTHMPSPEVLKKLGDVYWLRPTGKIKPLFDVGDPVAYRNHFLQYCTGTQAECDAQSHLADGYLVQSGYRGGEIIEESACTVDPNNPNLCQFPQWPGTVGWPLGFQLHRDAPVGNNGEELSLAQVQTWATDLNSLHRRRFDVNRFDYVHYVLAAHARGTPVSTFPCLNGTTPVDYDQNGMCGSPLTDNADFHIPRSVSGIADLPGGDVLMTLGLWTNFVGTPHVQASTLLHELGHNGYLWHGGNEAVFGDKTATPQPIATYIEPNCKPNYLSSMSYLFQVHGLYDDFGNLHLDYSDQQHTNLDENLLSDGALTPAAKYVPAWYAPASSPLALAQQATAASRFCSGAPFGSTPPPSMARVLAESSSSTIDWDGGLVLNPPYPDVNFDGILTPTAPITVPLRGFNDWANLRLNQTGAGRNTAFFGASPDTLRFNVQSGGQIEWLDTASGANNSLLVNLGASVFLDAASGDVFLDSAGGDVFLDSAGGDVFLDSAGGDIFVDASSGDVFFDAAGGDVFFDAAGGDVFFDAAGGKHQELSHNEAIALGRPAPSEMKVCRIGEPGCHGVQDPAFPKNRNLISWTRPTVGTILKYYVERRTGSTGSWVQIGVVTPPPGATEPATFFVDLEELPDRVTITTNPSFSYRAKAQFADPTQDGPPSPFPVTIAAVNLAPQGVGDKYAVMMNSVLNIVAPGVLGNDNDSDSPPNFRGRRAVLLGPGTPVLNQDVSYTTSTAHGVVVLRPDGSFTYTPTSGYFGQDSFIYKADDGLWANTAFPLSPYSPVTTVDIMVNKNKK